MTRFFRLAFATAALVSAATAQNDPRPIAASLLETVNTEHRLSGGAADIYTIQLSAGDFLHLVVDQRGIDVVLALKAPSGVRVLEVDSPNGAFGKEPLFYICSTPGDYRLDIVSEDPKAQAGTYSIVTAARRPARPGDDGFISAQSAFLEGTRLQGQRAPGSLDGAIQKYGEALAAWSAAGERERQALTHTALADTLIAHADFKLALSHLESALPLWRQEGDARQEASAIAHIGSAYASIGENAKALENLNQALPLLARVGDREHEGDALEDLGGVYLSTGKSQDALGYFERSLLIWQALGARAREALTINNIGGVYNTRGEKSKALEYFNQALVLHREEHDQAGEARALSNIGLIYWFRGDQQSALEYLARSLPLRRAVGDRRGEATTLNNLGLVYYEQGETQRALEHFNRTLSMRQAMDDRKGQAEGLNNIGFVYSSLGERQKAVDYYNRSLPLRRAVGDRIGEAASLNNIGAEYSRLGDKRKALDYYQQANSIAQAIGDRDEEGNTLSNMGSMYLALGDREPAADCLNRALALRRAVGNRDGEAHTLSAFAGMYASSGDREQALRYNSEALAIFRAIRNDRMIADTLRYLARLELQDGRMQLAQQHLEEAVGILESLRVGIVSASLRASWFASVADTYEQYVNLLMQRHSADPSQGYSALALAASERYRARSLLETLAETGRTLRAGVDPKLLERDGALHEQLAAAGNQQLRLLSRSHTDEQARALAREIEELTSEHAEVESQIRIASPGYAALTMPQPVTAAQIQQLLDPDTLLVEYALGAEGSYAWLVTAQSVTGYELPKRAEIESAARRLYEAMAGARDRQDADAMAAAAQLSDMIVRPMASALGARRLVVVAEGMLQYIPFAALPAGGSSRLLVAEHEIVTIPSASVLSVLRANNRSRTPAPKAVAVLADPVFHGSDARVTSAQPESEPRTELRDAGSEAHPGIGERAIEQSGIASSGLHIPRLPFSRREAEAISELVPPDSRAVALDFDASRDLVTDPRIRDYRVLHIASHGLLNTEHPELSGIVLSLVDRNGRSRDGFLSLTDIYNLQLGADLVILSACQTALGKQVKSEGLIGLTRGFMYAGAKVVVASLWKVDDRATAELMKRFYQAMWGPRQLTPAEALHAAQLELRAEERWSSPYYWSGFVLQGEWN